MAGLWCFVVLQIVLTAVFGYPSTVSTVQGYLTAGARDDEAEKADVAETPAAERVPGAERFVRNDMVDAAYVKPNYPVKFLEVQSPDFYGEIDRLGEDSASEEATDADDYGDRLGEGVENDKGVVASGEEGDGAGRDASSDDSAGMGQHFFPSFAPVFSLGHSRPPQLFHQDQFYGKSRSHPSLGPDYNPFRAYRDNSFKVPITIDDDPSSNNILGSGNFGVLKGGTYYNDEDVGDVTGGLFKSFYSNNGHGRPYSTNPRPQKYSNNDFFANFRDFADINIPAKTSFSEYVVVYVNKNGSKTDDGIRLLPPGSAVSGERPKNIIEQLTMLDNNAGDSESDASLPVKKSSLHKRKLALLQQEKASKERHHHKKKEPLEPLLALS